LAIAAVCTTVAFGAQAADQAASGAKTAGDNAAADHAASKAPDTTAAIAAAVQDPGRPLTQQAFDAATKPGDALAFARIKPGQTVVEFIPGDGYYTRIISKLVGPRGKFYAFVPFAGAINAETLRRQQKNVEQPVDAILALENLPHYPNLFTIWQFIGQDKGTIAVPAQADVVWTANYPTLYVEKLTATKAKDLPGVHKAIFAEIKPGGYYVVSGARSTAGTGYAQAENLGRVDPEVVKADLIAAGFVLDAESNALANPNDDHTQPASTFNGGADRFLLRFKKPADAPKDKRDEYTKYMTTLFGNSWISTYGTPGERHHFYHADGTYEELGKLGTQLQEGRWYVEANGLTCLMHQYPAPERGYTICSLRGQHKVGDTWVGKNARGDTTFIIKPGIVYLDDVPDLKSGEKAGND
jgi:predicted methyltransferase